MKWQMKLLTIDYEFIEIAFKSCFYFLFDSESASEVTCNKSQKSDATRLMRSDLINIVVLIETGLIFIPNLK